MPQGSLLAAAFVILDKALNARRFLLQFYRGSRHWTERHPGARKHDGNGRDRGHALVRAARIACP